MQEHRIAGTPVIYPITILVINTKGEGREKESKITKKIQKN
jgi:hypothetical protein